MTWIDSHCHPFAGSLRREEVQVFQRAREAGVSHMLVVGYDPKANEDVLRLIDREGGAWGAVGIHPCESAYGTEEAWAVIKKQAAHPKVVALGEMGLDFYHKPFSEQEQIQCFRRQIQLAKELDLACVVHSREAAEPTLHVLLEEAAKKVIFHCYSYDADFAKKVWEKGFYTSFSGVLTYPNAGSIQEAARLAPADLLLIETDCPWLPPQSIRGQRNEMAYVVEVGAKVAELRGESTEALQAQLVANFAQLFPQTIVPNL